MLARVERIDWQLAEYNEKHSNQITVDVVSGFLVDKSLARRAQGKILWNSHWCDNQSCFDTDIESICLCE